MKIESFKLGKGVDVNGKKEYIELTVKIPDGATDKDFQAEFTNAEYIIDNLLVGVPGIEKTTAPTQATQATSFKMLMTMEEFEAEPWKASQWVRANDKDRTARTGEDAFLPTITADKRLIRMINEAPNKKLELPPYEEIKFAGNGGLIARKGPKAKKNGAK